LIITTADDNQIIVWDTK